jgi:hypothetical protein
MEPPTPKPQEHECQWQPDMERCRAEIANIEVRLVAGHPDVAGLCLALSDWSEELRILEANLSS